MTDSIETNPSFLWYSVMENCKFFLFHNFVSLFDLVQIGTNESRVFVKTTDCSLWLISICVKYVVFFTTNFWNGHTFVMDQTIVRLETRLDIIPFRMYQIYYFVKVCEKVPTCLFQSVPLKKSRLKSQASWPSSYSTKKCGLKVRVNYLLCVF